MVKKVHYTWKDIEHMNQVIINLMYADNWRPDYIVGITRGGLVPASMMSNATGIKCHTLDVPRFFLPFSWISFNRCYQTYIS